MKKDFIKGISWLGALRGVGRSLAFVKTAILARILSPSSFGVFGIASIVLELLEVLTETGVNIFLVQEKDKVDKYVSTAWTVSIIRGLVISILLVFCAPFISGFFKSIDSLPLIYLIAVVPFIRGFINPAIIKFQKELTFNKEFFYSSSLFVVEAGVSIGLSILTHSPIALIWGMVASALVEVLLSFLVVSPRPEVRIDFALSKEIIKRGKWVTGAGIFNYLFLHGDDIIVGRVLGQTSLGFYQIAYRISILPITEVADIFGRVAFPAYVKIGEDKERLRRSYLKIVLGIAALVVPFGIVLFIFTKEIVLLVLGTKWIEIIPVLKVLIIYGVVRAIVHPVYALLLAFKKQKYIMLITFAGIVGLFVSIFPLISKYGMVGAGISALVGTAVTIPIIIYSLLKVL
ncbi:MAG: lipopolysaccharide biosynthesis protein [Patescibacteria group bacterium]